MWWDSNPGVREAQVVKTDLSLGPNEVQAVQLVASAVPEVQVVATRASAMHEVITCTFGTPSVDGGWFTVSLDTSATGGAVHTSGFINFDDAPAAPGGGALGCTSVQEILEAMPNVAAPVTVVRSSLGNGAYAWTVTFSGQWGDAPQLSAGTDQLLGAGARVSFSTVQDGNELSDSVALAFAGETTQAVALDESEAELKAELEALPSVGVVEVTRSLPDWQQG